MIAMADDYILSESPVKYIEWRIQNFFEKPTEYEYKLESAWFFLSDAKWRLGIIPNGEKKNDSSGFIGLYLKKDKSASEYRVKCRIGIKNIDGSEFAAVEYELAFLKTFIGACGYGNPKFIDRSNLLSLKDDVAPDGILTVFCNLHIIDKTPASPDNVDSASQTNFDDVSPLSEDFKNIYLNRRCTDVKLIVKSEVFYVHKTVLIARSPVFASMFDHNFLEKSSGKVEITDCDLSSFGEFLLFLYTGKLDDIPLKKAVDLYKTADKYDVKEVKEECVHIMRRNLCVDFFCDVIHLAEMHTESHLLKDATSFFIDNAESILSSLKWQQFLKENFLLCNELLLKLRKNNM